MGKKRRYRKFPQKLGRKYAIKYGMGDTAEVKEETLFEETPELSVMAAPDPVAEEPIIVAAPELVVEAAPVAPDPNVEAIEAATPPKKKRAPRKKATTSRKTATKSTTTPRKTTRKRTTRAKTAS